MNLISQMMKPRLREAESLAPGHRARIDGPISHSIKQEEHSILPPPQEPEFQPRSSLAVCPWCVMGPGKLGPISPFIET